MNQPSRYVKIVEWSDEDQTGGYLQISRHCLTTAFIITQTKLFRALAEAAEETRVHRSGIGRTR